MWHVWRNEEVCTRFLWGNLREKDHWGAQDIDGRIILRWIFRKWEWVGGTGWRDRRRALVSTVMNFGVPENAGNC